LPGAPAGLVGVVALEGRLLPAWSWEPAPAAWVQLEGGLVGGSAICPAPPGAPPLSLPEAPPPPAAAPRSATPAPARPAAPSPPATVLLRLGNAALSVPMAALRGLRPWPDRLVPVPGWPEGAMGYTETVDGPVLVLEPAWCLGAPVEEAPGHLAVLLHDGRRLGLPCHGAAPGTGGPALLSRLDGTAQGTALLTMAPCPVPEVPAVPVPRHALLLCRAGTARFFLPADAVEAVVPPRRPRPLPGGGGLAGVCAYRGLVLPIRDAACRLGAGAMPPQPPMLHLAGPHPVALAVSEVLGLRQVPAGDITPVAGNPLVAALVALEGQPVPLCHAAALASP
jgi:chemotaxis signal transduction protein